MAVNKTRQNVSYGLSDALIGVPLFPIITVRNPGVHDKAPVGSLWVNSATNASFILTSTLGGLSVWTGVGGTGAFAMVSSVTTTMVGTDLTVGGDAGITGDETVGGTLDVTGVTTLTAGIATTQAIGVASPINTAALASQFGQVTFTGFMTAPAASQDFIVTNAGITTTSVILVTAMNVGAAAAWMTVSRVLPAAGQITVTLVNNGAGALNGDVLINVAILSF